MLPAKRAKEHTALEQVHELFERWRKSKTGRDPIPESLWEAAVSLTGGYSVNRIARRLRLNHNDLKNRARNQITFIELPVAKNIECTIEIEKPTGERMRIKGSCNVTGLAREFWER
ncbi:MAG: hypothetical protein PHU49_09900 [Syntrophorhabdaceae bacterium]|jgi:hypothetical protein|nr:hypothetical protein [Syntrophorhabdaceae bacterium]MDD5244318.1 hypothetical protein [Syntrophorhabdaceae bacterium]